MKTIARKRFTAFAKQFSPGDEIDPTAFGPSLTLKLMNTGFLKQVDDVELPNAKQKKGKRSR